MINSVGTVEIQNRRNSFEEVSQNTSAERYWITSQNLPQDKPLLGSIKIMTPEKARKTHNAKAIGISIASATILTAAGVFFFLKGGPKGLSKGLEALRNVLEERIQKSKLNNNIPPKVLSTYEFIIRNTDSILKRAEAINNYTTIKDYSLKKIMCNKSNSSILSKLHSGITEMFMRIAKKTVISSYKNTESIFKEIGAVTDKANGRILSMKLPPVIKINKKEMTKYELLEKITESNSEILRLYKMNFSPQKVNSRFKRLLHAALDTEREFDKKGFFWFLSKDTLKSFVAENSMLAKKTKIQSEINSYRHDLSYSRSDMLEEAEKKIIEITKEVDYKDSEKLQLLRNIRIGFKELQKSQGSEKAAEIEKYITKNIRELKNKFKDSSAETVQTLNELVEFKNFKQGKIQELLEIYKEVLPQKDYEEVEKAFNIGIKSLDSSIKKETEDFVNKLRDLILGSAPTDIMAMLSGVFTLGFFLEKAEDFKEKTSVALKYGIPALVGIGTSLYGNAKLFAGSKSLAFGAISMWVTNKIGDWANNILQKYWNKNSEK